jgi:nicotinamide phosphoribosyltransferase
MDTLIAEQPETFKGKVVTLPARRVHFTPRLLRADAYTIGADKFQSPQAKEKSVYYCVFRRELYKINPDLYVPGDNRIIFAGLQRIIERLFYKPITHEEIDHTLLYLATFKVTTAGLARYDFPEALWRRVVDEFNGRPPIEIKAMPEGSVVYPGEPVIQVKSLVKGFGELAAWFESKILHVWAVSERITQNEHWLKKLKEMVREVDPTLTEEMNTFFATLMEHDFGDRAGICDTESEDLGMAHLYTFPGTDTCAGGYQAFMNSGQTPGLSVSVNALAHRNVQAYDEEGDCYLSMYEKADNNEILSMVADCYDYKAAVKNHLLPLALRSVAEKNGKVVVGRPDSDVAVDCVLYLCDLAVENGLYEERVINGKTWKFGTTLKFIEGDGMDFKTMWDIIVALMKRGYAPYGWGLFGVGGGLRNFLKRDNFGAKYALSARGEEEIPVVKLSETIGKTTLPGPHKVLRSVEALEAKKTIVFEKEPGEDAMVLYFNGLNIYKPFGPGQDDDFIVIKNRIRSQFPSMPHNLDTPHGAPASDAVLASRIELIKKYAPSKNIANY